MRATTEGLRLTPEGEAARNGYDYLKHDPAMRCTPATFTRVMHTPSPPIEVRQHADHVEINYEFMDVHRYYAQPMTVTFTYLRLPDGQILEWGCTPGEAGYERFLPASP